MRHQFVRLFLAIILIAFAVILVQCCVLFVGNWQAARNWKNIVFEEFISSLKASISNLRDLDDAENDNVMRMMVSQTSERISGLLLRDRDGRFVLSLGMSPAGEQMPSPEARHSMAFPQISDSRLKLSYQNSINYVDVDIPSPKYDLSIRTFSDTMIPVSSQINRSSSDEDLLVSLPSIIADQDIAGTIRIVINDEVVGYIDVLVYRIDFYSPTLYVARSLLLAFCVSLPFALIVSAILAVLVSRWNTKSVKEIQGALSDLSKGYFDVDIPKQNTEEMSEIAESITVLGKDLSRHQRSRKEWIRNISHDLNTPVTSLNILINGALDGVFSLDKDLLLSMKNENDTLMSRIRSVAYYSYLLSPDATVNYSEVSIRSLVEETAGNINIACTLPDCDVTAEVDPELLGRAIAEVLTNASSYKDSEKEPSVDILRDGENIHIIITNSGHLPSPLPQFFEPWARGDQSRTAGGSGLGLPIAYQIMELHNGSISIKEADGTVIVTLTIPQGK